MLVAAERAGRSRTFPRRTNFFADPLSNPLELPIGRAPGGPRAGSCLEAHSAGSRCWGWGPAVWGAPTGWVHFWGVSAGKFVCAHAGAAPSRASGLARRHPQMPRINQASGGLAAFLASLGALPADVRLVRAAKRSGNHENPGKNGRSGATRLGLRPTFDPPISERSFLSGAVVCTKDAGGPGDASAARKQRGAFPASR